MKHTAINALRSAGHTAMRGLEARLQAGGGTGAPPTFIIGAPRSGTTLLYELMITRFRFAYLSNAANRFYLTPLASSWVFQPAINKWRGNFKSRYGHIAGWGAPNEGGNVWLRWLSEDGWTDGQDFPDQHIMSLRSLTSRFSALFDAPFLNKNVMHSNRLRLMHRIWPDALFIHLVRDPVENARSIVRAERALRSPTQWWSVRPRLADDFVGRHDTQRAIAQVLGCALDIKVDSRAIGSSRIQRVGYTALCRQPRAELDRIRGFLRSHGITIEEGGNIPDSFAARQSIPLRPAEEADFVATLDRLEANIDWDCRT